MNRADCKLVCKLMLKGSLARTFDLSQRQKGRPTCCIHHHSEKSGRGVLSYGQTVLTPRLQDMRVSREMERA